MAAITPTFVFTFHCCHDLSWLQHCFNPVTCTHFYMSFHTPLVNKCVMQHLCVQDPFKSHYLMCKNMSSGSNPPLNATLQTVALNISVPKSAKLLFFDLFFSK